MQEAIQHDLRLGMDHDAIFERSIRRQAQANAMPGLSDTSIDQLVEVMCDDPVVAMLFDRVYKKALSEQG